MRVVVGWRSIILGRGEVCVMRYDGMRVYICVYVCVFR